MKLKALILTAVILFTAALSQAQDLNIAVSYLYGEKSKDSYATEESYAISNTSVVYSVNYTGHKSKNQKDFDKTCTFTEQDLKNIRKSIETKGLNVIDSLYQESSKTKSYEVYTRINIAISMDGQEYKININGDTAEFKDEALYKNAEFFVSMLRKMVDECK